jgi:hypothetical protein
LFNVFSSGRMSFDIFSLCANQRYKLIISNFNYIVPKHPSIKPNITASPPFKCLKMAYKNNSFWRDWPNILKGLLILNCPINILLVSVDTSERPLINKYQLFTNLNCFTFDRYPNKCSNRKWSRKLNFIMPCSKF